MIASAASAFLTARRYQRRLYAADAMFKCAFTRDGMPESSRICGGSMTVS
jgi:hypothetical protein